MCGGCKYHMSLQIVVKCIKCKGIIEDAGNRSRRYCEDCSKLRKRELEKKHNNIRAFKREYKRIQINLFKSWVMWGEMR